MQETYVCLHFACDHCANPVSAKLHCCGSGLAGGPHVTAGVKITCPHCRQGNEVFFEMTGLVLAVVRDTPKRLLEPSLN